MGGICYVGLIEKTECENMKLPIPYTHIVLWPDKRLVPSLLRMEELPTAEFFYGKSYPVFKSLYDRYHTDCAEVIDFIHEIYIDILKQREVGHRCKLETFNFKCSLKNWVGVVAIRYCYYQFKRQIQTEELLESDRNSVSEPSILTDMGTLNHEDVEAIINMMPNERYRQLIRYRYLEELDNEETAQKMGMSMENYYNKHRAAKVQYIQAFLKEMSR